MGARVSSFSNALYDSKKKQFLGRDGAGWGKLGVFYFFFYIGLAGFFCAMLAVFMALSPRDRPRYFLEESRMRTRSNPLSPGLGFRPQPTVDRNVIYVNKNGRDDQNSAYVRNLNQYLEVYYWKQDRVKNNTDSDEESGEQALAKPVQAPKPNKFQITRPGECRNATGYGFSFGRPCILVKMNKIVGFSPKPGAHNPEEKEKYRKLCDHKNNAVAVHCSGEYPADVDNIGPLNYISESGPNYKCGELETKWFPYQGKVDREDVYQAPYVWVQFLNPKPNVLINVICRVYAQNIEFDKKAGRALTRFQIFVEDNSKKQRKSEYGL